MQHPSVAGEEGKKGREEDASTGIKPKHVTKTNSNTLSSILQIVNKAADVPRLQQPHCFPQVSEYRDSIRLPSSIEYLQRGSNTQYD